MKTRRFTIFVLPVSITLLFLLMLREVPLTPLAQPPLWIPESSIGNSLLQFTSGGYVLGFHPGETYDATTYEVDLHVGGYDPIYPLIDPELTWHTFLGSASNDYSSFSTAVDGAGNVYVTGSSYATWGTPINPFAGNSDVFVAKLNNSGVRQWHTFLGSASIDTGSSVTVDGNGNIYVAGSSEASWGSPVSPFQGSRDAFVAKLNSNGVWQWHTFLGSAGYDASHAIAVDGTGNVYVTGSSLATWGTPVNPFTGGYDAFVAKLNNSGVRQWNTFLGSGGIDHGYAIDVDGAGNAYVSGVSWATWGTPINAYTGGGDAFATKLNSNGSRQWHTFLGSTATDFGRAIVVDGAGNVYTGGESLSSWGSPVSSFTGGNDAFVVKLNNNGVRQWHTFMGSTEDDWGYAIDVDGSGNVYMVGESVDTWGTPNNPYTGDSDGFLAKLNSSGVRQWNSFLGSPGYDASHGIDVDGNGNAYVAGNSGATWGTPVNPFSGGADVFVAKLAVGDATGSLPDFNTESLVWSPIQPQVMEDSKIDVSICNLGADYVPGSGQAYLDLKLFDTASPDKPLFWRFPAQIDSCPTNGQKELTIESFWFTNDRIDTVEACIAFDDPEIDPSNNCITKNITVSAPTHPWRACAAVPLDVVILYIDIKTAGGLSLALEISKLFLANQASLKIACGPVNWDLSEKVCYEAHVDYVIDIVITLFTEGLTFPTPVKAMIAVLKDIISIFSSLADCVEFLFDYVNAFIVEARLRGYPVNAIIAHSPIYLRVTDQTGRQAGFSDNGDPILEIPDTEVAESSGAKIIVYPGIDTKLVELTGTGSGTFDLIVSISVPGDQVHSINYQNVPITTGAKGKINVTNGQYTLAMDDNGDGTTDREIQPNEEIRKQISRVYLPIITKK